MNNIEHGEVAVQLEQIGPAEAQSLLSLNTHNRSIRRSQVHMMARDMVGGKWILNGETIKVSNTGTLIDGQHRLLGVVESGVTIPLLVIRGLDESTQDTIDIGAKRSFADVLGLAGEENSHNLASAIRFAWFLEYHGQPKVYGINPSIPELQAYFEKHQNLRRSLQPGRRAGSSAVRYPPSAATALHFLMSRADPGLADRFWVDLAEGNTTGEDPIHVLREALLRDLSKAHRMEVDHRAALTIKAWHFWLDQKKIKAIQFKPGIENYPKLQLPNGNGHAEG